MKELLDFCVEKLIGHGYEEYILANMGLAVEAVRNGGCIFDIDCMEAIETLTGITPSYELYRYIDSYYTESLMELGVEDIPDLQKLIMEFVTGKTL